MNELLYYYDVCSRLINYYETRIRLIDLETGNVHESWKEAEEKLRGLLKIQSEIVRRISDDPNFTKFRTSILANIVGTPTENIGEEHSLN